MGTNGIFERKFLSKTTHRTKVDRVVAREARLLVWGEHRTIDFFACPMTLRIVVKHKHGVSKRSVLGACEQVWMAVECQQPIETGSDLKGRLGDALG
jgi:hypothetical protein